MTHTNHTPYLIGIDIGTSSAKTTIIDSHKQVIIWKDEEYSIDSPRRDWAEQNPEQWVAAAVHTLRDAVQASAIDVSRVMGIGLAGQMHGMVCLDAAGNVLRPAIIWADRRSKSQLEQLQRQIGVERLAEWTGNPIATGFMLPSWVWLAENEPEIARKTRYLLLPKDYLRYRLTGAIGAEPSDASSTLLFDPHKRRWCQPLLDEIGLSIDQLPPLGESAGIAGGLLPEFAYACGLPSGIPVVYGGSDVACQALGQGIIHPGTVSCTIGTGGQLFAPISKPVHDPELRLHLFCHVIPDHWHLEGAILSAGLSLRWLRDHFWQGESYDSLANAAQQVEAAAQGIFFLPYLAGERTPIMDPTARAAFVGLSYEHGRAHIVRAVMEGVVFALRQGLDLMRSLDVPIDRLVATGGSIRHPLWLQLQADIFNIPVTPADTPQATGLGAALLAGTGVGIYKNTREVIQQDSLLASDAILPDPRNAEQYETAYQTYCKLYPALKSIR